MLLRGTTTVCWDGTSLIMRCLTYTYTSLSRKGPPSYFQERSVHQLEYIVFHPREVSIDHLHTNPPLVVGYVHYTSVNGSRRRQFEPCPGPKGAFNYIGERICRKREAQVTPEEWTGDPYFVCHLLALAQLQERRLELSELIIYTVRSMPLGALLISSL